MLKSEGFRTVTMFWNSSVWREWRQTRRRKTCVSLFTATNIHITNRSLIKEIDHLCIY